MERDTSRPESDAAVAHRTAFWAGAAALLAGAAFLEYIGIVVVASLVTTRTDAGSISVAAAYVVGSLAVPIVTAGYVRKRRRSSRPATVMWAAGASLATNLVLAPLGLGVMSM